MSVFSRIALALALVLPITAYVAGTLLAADPAPAEYDPIVIEQGTGSSPTSPGLVDPDPSSTPPGTTGSPSQEPQVVRPTPVDPDDDDDEDDEDDDRDERDDDRDDERRG